MSRSNPEGFAGVISRYEVRDQLNRILLSRHFNKARKKSRFLEFMCEQAVSGKADEINEYTVAVDIYERGADFNPQEDSIVRVQAHEIRKALLAYYAEAGAGDRLKIELPAGRYVPQFTRIGEKGAGCASEELPATPVARRVRWYLAAAVVLAALGAGWLGRGILGSGAANSPARLPESSAWFWRPFLPPAQPPLVVLPVHPLLRAAHGGDTPATLNRGLRVDKETIPEFRDTIHFRELAEFRFVPNTTDFTAVGEALGLLNIAELLGSAGQKVRPNAGRLVDYEAVKGGNSILLGGNQPWSGRIFVYKEGFEFRNGVITNNRPLPGEQPVYRPEFDPVTGNLSRDYGLVLMLPNERRERRVLLIYGIYTQGSQAAIEYVTNADRLGELRKALVERSADRKTVPNYFQVLISTSVENFVPGKVSLVGVRVLPE